MVLNHPKLASGDYPAVYEDISAVRKTASPHVVLKVILETSQLSPIDIMAGCVIAKRAGADFVKTSTGFCGTGATVEDVALMKAIVGHETKVKASGGVRTVRDCVQMIEAGADRIGASAGVAIMREGRTMDGKESEAAKAGGATDVGY